MTSRDVSQKRNAHIIIIAIVLVVLTSVIFFVFWSRSPNSPTLHTSTVKGIVTLIQKSCSAQSIDKDEDTSALAICDGGESIRVDDKMVETSSGGPGAGFHTDIDSVKLGDTVTVHYIVNEYGGFTLDCETCSIDETLSE